MLYDMNYFLKLVKKSAVEAVEASKPTNVVFGKVISTSPLKIMVDQKLTLGSMQLVLSKNVMNRSVSVTINGTQYTGTINNALKNGDEVILLQVSGSVFILHWKFELYSS